MADERDDLSGRSLESFYVQHLNALMDIAVAQFRVSDDVAEETAHEILISSLRNMVKATDLEAWLAGAMRQALDIRMVGHEQQSH